MITISPFCIDFQIADSMAVAVKGAHKIGAVIGPVFVISIRRDKSGGKNGHSCNTRVKVDIRRENKVHVPILWVGGQFKEIISIRNLEGIAAGTIAIGIFSYIHP